MACKNINIHICNYESGITYQVRLRLYRSKNVPTAGSKYFKQTVLPDVTFEGISDKRYQVGLNKLINGIEDGILWEDVVDESVGVPVILYSSATGPSITLNWTAVAGATDYEYRIDNKEWQTLGNVLTKNITGLGYAELHKVEIRAIKGNSVSAPGKINVITFSNADNTGIQVENLYTLEKVCNCEGEFEKYRMRYFIGGGLKSQGSLYNIGYSYKGTTTVIAFHAVVAGDTYKSVIKALASQLQAVNKSIVVEATGASFDIIDRSITEDEFGEPLSCSEASNNGNYVVMAFDPGL